MFVRQRFNWSEYLLPVEMLEVVRAVAPDAKHPKAIVHRTFTVPVARLHYAYMSNHGVVHARYPKRKQRREMWRRGEPSPIMPLSE